MKKMTKILLCAVCLFLLCTQAVFADEAAHEAVNESLPLWSMIPFACMLLSIAVFPLVKPEWWEKNMLKVAIGWSLLFIIPFAAAYGVSEAMFRILESILLDYIPFLVLLLGLFVAAGGIAVKGTLVGTTFMNIIILAIGTALASWIGTTGAAMLMIRPLIKANAWRARKAHIVVFFIFTVANMGGCLTPLGDPPLFMGFNRGVPFMWTMKLLPLMIVNFVLLMALFAIIDHIRCKQEYAAGRSPKDMVGNEDAKEKISIEGGHNVIFIAMVILGVILSGVLPLKVDFFANGNGITVFPDVVFPYATLLEIIIILIASYLSMKTTKRSTRQLNGFNFGPIEEVAKLFIGIFLTMIPAIGILKVHGAELGITEPWQMFWATGLLSSFLDNTPTYLVFLQTAGTLGATTGVSTSVGMVAEQILIAISAGAVFMGANTYIGNAPNFMVKAIAEENGVKMPSFFGYMAWSFGLLVPVLIVDTFIFFL